MNTELHKRVLETIRRHAMIRAGNRVGLGVSGGADSVAMFRIFADLRERLGITVFALHFNHQLRGREADEDERFAKSLAAEFAFEFESGRAGVKDAARERGWNLEDAARRLRYTFFSACAEGQRLDRVAVAHTANDQAETVLSHLLRGSGLTGIAGIYPVAGRIIRPLLEVRREDLREYLRGLGQPWREDATNLDVSRTRARIRHELIPVLIRDFEPAAVTRLARLAQHARENEAFWLAIEDERFRALVRSEKNAGGLLTVHARELLDPLPLLSGAGNDAAVTREPLMPGVPASMALSRRLIRRIFTELRGGRERLTARHVDAVMKLASESQSGASLDLPGVCVERIFDRLCFRAIHGGRSAAPQIRGESEKREFVYTLSPPSPRKPASIVVSEIHRRINLKRVDWPPRESETDGRGALDFDRVRWPLVLRNWRPGDSYRPHGSRRVRKLKRMLLESRVPQSARRGWPVLTSDGKVIWASGYPVAEELAVHPGTQTGLVIGEEDL